MREGLNNLARSLDPTIRYTHGEPALQVSSLRIQYRKY
jgi:hypothetical protein